jgi:glycosyltransferase involved in cell wall biosynthesis
MRILAFNYEYPPLGGGGGVVFSQIMAELAQRHDVLVVTSAYSGLPRHEAHGRLEIQRVPVLARTGLSTATMPSMLSYWPSSAWRGMKLARRGRFDIVNSHFAVPSAPSADMVARWFRIPHVLSIHGGDIFDPSKRMSPHRLPLVRPFVSRLLRRADCVVAQSTDTANNARLYYRPERSIEIIPLGIVPSAVTPVPRAELGLGENRFVMVTVGRLVARKNLDDLLHVLARRSNAQDLLVVIGDGPKRAEWQALARSLGLDDRIRFEGRVDEGRKQRLLAASDAFVSTSEHEGFGLVFLEAMDRGLPVVTYDRGGHRDFLSDGVTGGVVPLRDREAFAAAIARLHVDPAYRMRCAEHNRTAVRKYYIGVCAAQYEALFEKLLARRTAAHAAHAGGSTAI